MKDKIGSSALVVTVGCLCLFLPCVNPGVSTFQCTAVKVCFPLGKGETQAALDAYEGHGGPKEGRGMRDLLKTAIILGASTKPALHCILVSGERASEEGEE